MANQPTTGSFSFNANGSPVEINQSVQNWKQQNINGLVQPLRGIANSAMDLISAYASSCGNNAPFTMNVSASGSQDPATDHPTNPKPTLSISIS